MTSGAPYPGLQRRSPAHTYVCVCICVCVCVCVCVPPRLHYRLPTLCPAPTDPVGQSWHVCMHICMYVCAALAAVAAAAAVDAAIAAAMLSWTEEDEHRSTRCTLGSIKRGGEGGRWAGNRGRENTSLRCWGPRARRCQSLPACTPRA